MIDSIVPPGLKFYYLALVPAINYRAIFKSSLAELLNSRASALPDFSSVLLHKLFEKRRVVEALTRLAARFTESPVGGAHQRILAA